MFTIEARSTAARGPNIVLTGFMATGKTTVGRLLADRLGFAFVDTDDLIAARAGRSVARIFAEMGEAAFRRMESEAAKDLGAREGLVISTGGRLMLDPENAAALSRGGRVFCLAATAEEILRRLSAGGRAQRPLLADAPDPMKRILRLLAEREPGYGRLPQVRTSGKTPEQVADTILAAYRTGAPPGDRRAPRAADSESPARPPGTSDG